MDFSKPISIATGTATSAIINLNSLTSSPGPGQPLSGYFVDSVSYGNIGVSGFVDKLAQRDGADTDIATLSSRSVQMIVQVFGSSMADLHDRLNNLNQAFQPYPEWAASNDGFRALNFTQQTIAYSAYSSSGIPLTLFVRPLSTPAYNLRSDAMTPQTSDRGGATTVSITLFCKDPRKLGPGISTTFSTSTTTVTNNGNYNAYPIITLSSTATTVVTIAITDVFRTEVTVPASTTVDVDSNRRIITTFSGGLSQTNMTLLGSTSSGFPYIPPGSKTFSVVPSGGVPFSALTVTMNHREAWI